MCKKLNVGCYGDYREGWVNHEHPKLKGKQKADVYFDLDKFPYPVKDNTFDHIYLRNVLEHLNEPIKVVDEFHRILKPYGTVRILVPHGTCGNGWGDLTHKRLFGVSSMRHFGIGDGVCDYYSAKKWRVKTFLYWISPVNEGRFLRYVLPFTNLVNRVININEKVAMGFEMLVPLRYQEVEFLMTPKKG